MSSDPLPVAINNVCWNEEGHYYRIRNEALIAEIVRDVRAGHYCTVLGPPYCQKSDLLDDVKQRLQDTGNEVCVLLDLKQIDDDDEEGFLKGFAARFEQEARGITGVTSLVLADMVTNEAALLHFFEECLDVIRCDIVLLLDHLERVHIGPLSALLRVLRGLFSGRTAEAGYRVGVVTANALSTASLALGPTSPFNIARIKLVEDLTPQQSSELISYMASQKELAMEPAALERCIRATGGDRYLIPKLCERCDEPARRDKRITEQYADEAVRWFVEQEAARHPPLQETVRAIEADPNSLLNILTILERGRVPRQELRLDLSADIDDLRLTGAVREEAIDGQRCYRMRNEIYEHHLRQHFRPERAVHVLTMAGEWHEAIRFLVPLVVAGRTPRSLLLNTITDAIYSATSEADACKYLLLPVTTAFSIPRVRFYRVAPDQSELGAVDQYGFDDADLKNIALVERSRPEVKALRRKHYEVSRSESWQTLHVPLIGHRDKPLGVISLDGLDTDPRSDEFLELMAFLKQIGRALESLSDREEKLHQLETLRETGKIITESLDFQQVLQATVEGAIHAVPAAQRGSLFLWNNHERKLVIEAQIGFRDDIVQVMRLNERQGYVGWCYAYRQPLRLDNVIADPRTFDVDHPDVKQEKSAICVPLEAWGRRIGVICLDNTLAYGAFDDKDLGLLSTLSTQAAIAIQNAQLHAELFILGLRINRGDLRPQEVFKETVQSITRVTSAKGANMLLLRNTDQPEVSIREEPILSVSDGLGLDYDATMHPRKHGLAYKVLRTQEPAAVSRPDQSPGINPLAREAGTQAYVCLPMKIQETVIGVLFVHYDGPHEFSSSEVKMLSLFANEAALAIQNARQREDLEITEKVAWVGITFSTLAHRITQKSAAIRNTVWGLRKQLGGMPTANERLNRIEENAQYLNALAKEVVKESFDEQLQPVDFNQLLSREVPRWHDQDDKATIDLDPKDAIVWGDPARLAFVIEILTTNAVRAMRKMPERALTVRSVVHDRRVEVTMTNTGAIPEHARPLLFQQPIPTEEGLGIGLLIARYVLMRYGGDIGIAPSPSGKTTIAFWLPLHSPGE